MTKLNYIELFSTVLEAREFKVEVLSGLVPSGNIFLA